ncbi:hypothetical protein M744_11605 [Synechococcus elongatus UTEX 2973]|nr:hypothetical protein M744_11605 [Synechococcus elongatus UTEX 2973]
MGSAIARVFAALNLHQTVAYVYCSDEYMDKTVSVVTISWRCLSGAIATELGSSQWADQSPEQGDNGGS